MGHPKPAPVGIAGLVKNAKQLGQEILTATISAIQLREVLAAYQNEPPGTTRPARDLTDQQAFDLLMHLVYRGELVLDEKIRPTRPENRLPHARQANEDTGADGRRGVHARNEP